MYTCCWLGVNFSGYLLFVWFKNQNQNRKPRGCKEAQKLFKFFIKEHMIAEHHHTHFSKITKSSNHFISMNIYITRDISNSNASNRCVLGIPHGNDIIWKPLGLSCINWYDGTLVLRSWRWPIIMGGKQSLDSISNHPYFRTVWVLSLYIVQSVLCSLPILPNHLSKLNASHRL